MSATLPPPELVEVAEGAFAYVQPDGSWFINNAGLVVAPHGLISIDTCATERRTRAYLEAIRSLSGLPVRTVVNTHHHGDHTHGNCLFRGATIVAHEATRDAVLATGPPQQPAFLTDVDWGALDLEPPFLTYAEAVTLWAGDVRIDVRHVGRAAHTTNDSIVWLPERRLLFSGDLVFAGVTPFFVQGSLTGAVRVLEDVVKPLDARTIVPGHGSVCGPEAVDDVLGYLHFVLETARDGRAAGLTPLEAARGTDLGPYADLVDSERIVGNLHRAYADLAGEPPGGPLDMPAVLSDMVSFNGGRPLRCLA